MAMQQSFEQRHVQRSIISDAALLACLTMDELFNGCTFARACLAPEDHNLLYAWDTPKLHRVFRHPHGSVRETVYRRYFGDKGITIQPMVMVTSDFTGETEEFITYKLASFWLNTIADTKMAEAHRKGVKVERQLGIPNLNHLLQMVRPVVQPQ